MKSGPYMGMKIATEIFIKLYNNWALGLTEPLEEVAKHALST